MRRLDRPVDVVGAGPRRRAAGRCPAPAYGRCASPLSAATSTPQRVSALVARSRSSSAVGSVGHGVASCVIAARSASVPSRPYGSSTRFTAASVARARGRLVRHPPAHVGRPQPVLGRERATVPAHQSVDVGAQLVHRERVGVRRQHDVEVQPAVAHVTEVGKHRTGHSTPYDVGALGPHRLQRGPRHRHVQAQHRPGQRQRLAHPVPQRPGPRRRQDHGVGRPGPRASPSTFSRMLSASSPSVSTSSTSSGDCPGNGSATRVEVRDGQPQRRPRDQLERAQRRAEPALQPGRRPPAAGRPAARSAVARSTGRCASSSVAAVTTPSRPAEPTARSVEPRCVVLLPQRTQVTEHGRVLVGQHDLHPEQPVPDVAVPQHPAAAGVGRHQPADARVRRQVDRQLQPVRCGRRLHLREQHAGRRGDRPVVDVQVERGGEPGRRQHAGHGVRRRAPRRRPARCSRPAAPAAPGAAPPTGPPCAAAPGRPAARRTQPARPGRATAARRPRGRRPGRAPRRPAARRPAPRARPRPRSRRAPPARTGQRPRTARPARRTGPSGRAPRGPARRPATPRRAAPRPRPRPGCRRRRGWSGRCRPPSAAGSPRRPPGPAAPSRRRPGASADVGGRSPRRAQVVGRRGHRGAEPGQPGVGQPGARSGAARRPRPSASGGSASTTSRPAGVSAMPRASTSPNRTRSSPGTTAPEADRIGRGSASARNDVCRSSTSGPAQRGGPWISSIISTPRSCIRR